MIIKHQRETPERETPEKARETKAKVTGEQKHQPARKLVIRNYETRMEEKVKTFYKRRKRL